MGIGLGTLVLGVSGLGTFICLFLFLGGALGGVSGVLAVEVGAEPWAGGGCVGDGVRGGEV